MEFLTFIAVVVLLIFFLVNISSLNGKLKDILREVEQLRKSVSSLEKTQSTPKPSKLVEEERPVIIEKGKPLETEPLTKKVPLINTLTSSYDDTVRAKVEAMKQSQASFEMKKPVPPATPKPQKQPTDLEKFVGENLMSKIGIIILVLGVGFFVKYAIDQEWIGVYGRAAIGLLTGGILISLAHYLRKSYKTFSSLLTGGGLAVFYLTIAIAYHQYHIFNDKSVVFIIMVVITIFSVLLSLAYDKKELAVFSQIGGYAAPFMVSTGEGNYMVLFSYMLILNAGLLVLAYFKRWHVLNLLAFFFTIVLFSGWLGKTFLRSSANFPYANALIFASAFYIVFFLANILNNIKERKPFKAVEIMMILSNNLFFFIWGLTILYNYQNGMYKGLFTVLAGLFNFGWVVYLYRQKQVDKNLIYLLVALVMSYISLAIPIQLNGHSITLFWTAELVILLWLSQVSGIKILKTGHLIILGLVIISLMMDWGKLYTYYNKTLPVIFNQAFITGVFVILGLTVTYFLLRREKEDVFINKIISRGTYQTILTFALFSATFIIPFLELNYQVKIFYPNSSFQIVIACIYIYAYLFVLIIITRNWSKAFKGIFILAWAVLIMYLLIFHTNVLSLRDNYIYGKDISTGNFLFHTLAIPFVAGIIFFLYKKHEQVLTNKFLINCFTWFISFLVIFIASTELDNILVLLSDSKSYSTILQTSHKVAYPILWGVCAFILILIGIKMKAKIIRIQALCLFALIILKLFIFDFWSMSEGGRVAAIIFLGVVLLAVSFLYQKLKNLIKDPNNL